MDRGVGRTVPRMLTDGTTHPNPFGLSAGTNPHMLAEQAPTLATRSRPGHACNLSPSRVPAGARPCAAVQRTSHTWELVS